MRDVVDDTGSVDKKMWRSRMQVERNLLRSRKEIKERS